jgi:hypothetical protein
MTRFEDWPQRLATFLAERQNVPFAWGSNDCLLFCADAIAAQTGADLAELERGSYSTEQGAADMIASFGESVADVLTAKLGAAKKPGFANRGDVVTVELSGVVAAGVVDETGRKIALFADGHGLVRVPVTQAIAAWGVG